MAISTSLPSNAFNFLNVIDMQVDPRTGQYTCAMTLPEIKANQLSGPDVSLQLSFNALNVQDSGFGKGWNLQLSQFDPRSGVLSLHTGETFTVQVGLDGNELTIPEKKIDSFHFYKEGDKRYRIDHKSGLIEILEVGQGEIAMPVQMLSPDGHSVTLEYVAFGTDPLLSSIRNADGTQLLSMTRTTNVLTLTLHPGTAFEARFVLNINDGQTTSIVLPTHDNASWRFGYTQPVEGVLCLNRVDTPAGGHETVVYSSKPHQFPGLMARKLPRVASHVRDPGCGLPPSITHYTYGDTDHNFLGFGSGIAWSDDGLDNLYKVNADYTYETCEIVWDEAQQREVRTTSRVFNKYHLLVLEKVCNKAKPDSSVGDAMFVTETTYFIDPDLEFSKQPAYCQLPQTVSQTWYYANVTEPRHHETVQTTYDNFGNLLTQVGADGVTETSTWYDKEGEDGCPPDPQGFVRNIKSKTVTPAQSIYGAAPTLKTRYRYGEYQGLAGIETQGLTNIGTWLALTDEILEEVVDGFAPAELRHINYLYTDAPYDAQQHGRLAQTLQTLNGQDDTRTTTTLDYELAFNTRAGMMAVRSTSTTIGYDDIPDEPGAADNPSTQVRKVITKDLSLLNGSTLSTCEYSHTEIDSEIVYQYDQLGRLTHQTVAPNTPYEAQSTFSYWLTNETGQQARQCTKDVKDVETISWLDGFNRVIKEERQDVDTPGNDPTTFRTTYTAVYNHLGQKTQETTVDWEGSKDVYLTTTYEYDVWGEEYKITGPDGVEHICEINPTQQTVTTWIQSPGIAPKISGKSRSTLNQFDKEDSVEVLDANDTVVSVRQYFYDGLGNCTDRVDEMGETTRLQYDAFSRLHTTTLPNYTEIRRSFAAHSTGDLPVSIDVFDGSISQCIGLQTFDGLNRRTTAKIGPRLQQFFYTGGQSEVSSMRTARNELITYDYKLGLVSTPVASTVGEQQTEKSDFNYDNKSAQLTTSTNAEGQHAFVYNANGQLVAERWTETKTSNQWETLYTHTLKGRPLTRVEPDGLVCTHTYDDKARIQSLTQGQVQATIEYNDLSQVRLITTVNIANQQTLTTELTYDDQGRETIRKMSLGADLPAQTITQTYRIDSKLESRCLQLDDLTELLETFGYDQCGRMTAYTCEGTNLPKDRYGNAIQIQEFSFDALDNITYVYTLFADGSTDDAFSYFAPDDPCRLIKVTHNHPDYAASCEFGYDADGNMENDENGQRLHYDIQSRLVRVDDAEGNCLSRYRYDAHNHLLGVTRANQSETLRFYQDNQLSRTEQGSVSTSYLYLDDQPLGQQQQNDPEQTLLLLSDGKNSVFAESSKNTLRKAIYGAYGDRNIPDDPEDRMQCLLGFNGEVRDEQSGWYLLGRGYRAYNPSLMRFHSPDSLSPFGEGGINPYVYCAGDPINFRDPTGHASRGTNWLGALGAAMSAVGMVLAIASVVAAAPAVLSMASVITVGLGLVGAAGGIYGMYEGIMATHARRSEDRDKHQMAAMIAGGAELIGGGIAIKRALTIRGKRQLAAAARGSLSGAASQRSGSITNLASGTNGSGNIVEDGAEAAGSQLSRRNSGSVSGKSSDAALKSTDVADKSAQTSPISTRSNQARPPSPTPDYDDAASVSSGGSQTAPKPPSKPIPNVTNTPKALASTRNDFDMGKFVLEELKRHPRVIKARNIGAINI